MNTVTAKKSFAYKMITILAAIAASVILPQLFHAIGAISGTGSAVGAALLVLSQKSKRKTTIQYDITRII